MTEDNIFLVDAGSQLIDTDGNLDKKYAGGDGLHLNSQGNAIWIQHLRNSLKNVHQNAIQDDNSNANIPIIQYEHQKKTGIM